MVIKKVLRNILLLGMLATSIVSFASAADTQVKVDEDASSVNDPLLAVDGSLLPERILGGFLDIRTPSSTTRVDIKKVREDGYNLIIIGFGEVYGTDISFYTSDSSSSLSNQTAVEKIKEAKGFGMKVLLAVGGVLNTFHPGVELNNADPKILGKGMSDEQINALASNIVKFLKKNDIGGIEYSIKKYTSPSF